MKIFNFINISFAIAMVSLISCGQENTNDTTTIEEPIEVAAIIGNYNLNPESSKATWERTLDQKPTKQKVKLFGSMVDVELGAVKLNTTGTANLTSGTLNTSDEQITDATAIFDMASLKFAAEKGNGLFDAKKYPNSTLEISNVEASDSSGYHAEGKLTIQDVSNTVDLNFEVVKSENSYLLKGSFTINTLDFPLRDKVKEKDINKDEIKIIFELDYKINS